MAFFLLSKTDLIYKPFNLYQELFKDVFEKQKKEALGKMIKSYAKLKKQNKEKFKIPKSAQDTVPIDTIYKDGIFRMGNRYSKSYRFLDINYSIASKEEKMDLFLNYGELLNSFDSSMMVKITINNRKIDLKQFKEDILIPLQNDKLDFYRKEYNHMLLDKLAESDDIVQEKYITITILETI